jgi:hypothetical protein
MALPPTLVGSSAKAYSRLSFLLAAALLSFYFALIQFSSSFFIGCLIFSSSLPVLFSFRCSHFGFWHGAPATLLGSWFSLVYAGASSPVCSLAGDIPSILQAVVVHVKHVSIDLSRQQLLQLVGYPSCHRLVALAAIPLQFFVISRDANLACTCACSY